MGVNAFKFGLNDVKVATWNNPESYGTAVDVESVQMMGFAVDTESGTLEGDDIITDVHSKNQSGTVQFRFAFKDLDVLSVITGITVTDSTPNAQVLPVARDNMQYFAICGRTDATEGGGDTQVFIPKCKVMEGFNVSMEKGQYVIEDLTVMAVYEGTTHGIGWIINNATAQNVTIPPTVYAG